MPDLDTVVVDASVIVKWLFNDPEREEDTDRAGRLMSAIVEGDLRVIQPVHWLVEVAAVLARESPRRAERDSALLAALDLPTANGPEIIQRASRLAVDLAHHLFDTLYHAVALERQAVLVTADDRYLQKAKDLGSAIHIGDVDLS